MIVVKVGGSLFDLPDLGPHLERWLIGLNEPRVLLVPGGGPAAEMVRNFDRVHHLGEEKAHWLALRATSWNAYFLADVLAHAEVIGALSACESCWRRGRVPILDAFAFARADDSEPGRLPHSWQATSDSLAARAATVAGAARLILLKSVDFPAGIDWHEAGRSGYVDACFARLIQASVTVTACNFRKWCRQPKEGVVK